MQASEVKIGQRVKHKIVEWVGTVVSLNKLHSFEDCRVQWDNRQETGALIVNLEPIEQENQVKSHVHAKLMKQYAEDAAKSETPWENWQVLAPGFDKWYNLNTNPEWFQTNQYRRKPKQKFIEFNGKKFEIFAEKPERGVEYWFVDVVRNVDVCQYHYDSTFDADNFDINNCFKDEKTAKAFAEELKKIFNNVVES